MGLIKTVSVKHKDMSQFSATTLSFTRYSCLAEVKAQNESLVSLVILPEVATYRYVYGVYDETSVPHVINFISSGC